MREKEEVEGGDEQRRESKEQNFGFFYFLFHFVFFVKQIMDFPYGFISYFLPSWIGTNEK